MHKFTLHYSIYTKKIPLHWTTRIKEKERKKEKNKKKQNKNKKQKHKTKKKRGIAY